jgi:hypothetical protein
MAACSVPDCDRPISSRGWCRRHYVRWLRTGDPLTVRRRGPAPKATVCAVEGCQGVPEGRGMCRIHYSRWRFHGDPLVVLTPGQRRDPAKKPILPPRVKGVCSVEGCDRPHWARGWCSLHYQQWWRARQGEG